MTFKSLFLSAVLFAFASATMPALSHQAGDPVAPAVVGAKLGAKKKPAKHGQAAPKHGKKAAKAAKAAKKSGKGAKRGKGAKPGKLARTAKTAKTTKAAKRHVR